MSSAAAEANHLQSGLLCLSVMATLNRVPTDFDQLKHHFGHCRPGLEAEQVLRAARHLTLRARQIESSWARLTKTHLPAIGIQHSGRFFIVGRVQDDKVMVQFAGEPQPAVLTRDEFEEMWSGKLILITSRAQLTGENRRFGFSWFIPSIVKYRRLLGEVLAASFVLQIFALISPLFFQIVIDKVLVQRGLSTLDVLVIGLLAISCFESLLGGMRTYLFSHTTNRIDVELGTRLFHHLISLPLPYFTSRRVGDSVARVRELENIRNFLTGSALTAVIDLFFTVVFLAVMFWYSVNMTWMVLASLPFYVIVSLLVVPVFKARLDQKFNRGAENQAFLVETVSSIETIKSMAVEPHIQRRWEEQLSAYIQAAFRVSNLGNLANQAVGFINKLCSAAILFFGAHAVLNGDLTVGQLVAFNMLAGRVSSPVLRLAQLWQDFQQVGISVQRLGDVLNVPAEPVYQAGKTRLPRLDGRIALEHVTFRYRPDRAEVLKDISLDIPAGKIIGIVGRSGCGKSTLTKIVQRLFVPESGRVLIDGIDIATIDPSSLRRQIGVVLQENTLFNASIRANIALADPSASIDRIIEAAKLAGAHEFIGELPDAYETLVGEHGANLSGGQRQRIAIARALVTSPRILIFDEATSALDYESESIIQRNMQQMCRGRTVLIIAHRLSAVRHADSILVLEKGRIVEQGRHGDLLAINGHYARLTELQAQGAI